MIKMLPLRDNEKLAELNLQENTTARLGYCMYENEQIGGYILYNLTEEQGIIQAINSPDDMITDGLVRAVLASLFDFGINKAIFNKNLNTEIMDTIQRLNFVKRDEYEIASIEDILYCCKNCKK